MENSDFLMHMRGKFIHTKCEVILFARHAPFDVCPLLVGRKQFQAVSSLPHKATVE
jgi:hypothetical protein